MATQLTPQVHARINSRLDSFAREIEWAVDLVSRWDDVEEIERIDLWAEWPLIMEFYLELVQFDHRQQMTKAQQNRFHTLRHFFQQHVKILASRLGDDLIPMPPAGWLD